MIQKLEGLKSFILFAGTFILAFAFFQRPALAQPSAPIVSAEVSGTTVSLSWTVPSGTATFEIRRSTIGFPTYADSSATTVVSSLPPSTTTYANTGLDEGTYYYSIFAIDSLGDPSNPGNPSGAVTIDITPPQAPSNVEVNVSGSTVNLSWNNPVSDFSSITIRRSSSGFPTYADVSATTVVTGLTDSIYANTNLNDGTYYYSIFAIDSYGNVSNAGNPSSAVTIDTESPSAPSVTAEVSGTTVNLSWTVPSDTATFEIRRSTIGFPAYADSSATTVVSSLPSSTTIYVNTGLDDGTYYYSIFAIDAYGNVSNPGNPSGAVTVDITAPSAPSNVEANVSGSTVNLSWNNPSSDFSSITICRSTASYPISVDDGDVVASGLSSDTYTDANLSDGTYYYSIFALDTFGNASSPATVSVVVNTSLPIVTTSSASGFDKNTATLNASIDNIGGSTPTERGFQYGTTTSYENNTTENGSFSTGSFSASVSDLTCGTTYHYRSYATNTQGTSYGEDVTFETNGCSSTFNVTIDMESENVLVGEDAHYDMGIENTGDSDATDVPVSVTVSGNQSIVSIEENAPTSFSFISSAYASESLHCTLQSQTATCIISSIPAHSTFSLMIISKVNSAGSLTISGSAGDQDSGTNATNTGGGSAVTATPSVAGLEGGCSLNSYAKGERLPLKTMLLLLSFSVVIFIARRQFLLRLESMVLG